MSVAEMPTTELVVRPTIEARAKCWDCLQNKQLNLMETEVLCKACHNARDYRRKKLMKQKAAGKALRRLADKIGKHPAIVQKPHEMYADIMERIGGHREFAKMFVEDFLDCRSADPKPRKVLLDYSKAIIALGLEAQKTAPESKSTSTMTDDELTAEAARLANEELAILLEEEQKMIADGTINDEEATE